MKKVEFQQADSQCIWAKDVTECCEMLRALQPMLNGHEMLVIEDGEGCGRIFEGRPILKPEQAAAGCKVIVYGARSVTAKRYAHAVSLDAMLGQGVGVTRAQSEAEKERQWYTERAILKHHPHTLLRLEIQVSEHCNLNCRGCSHYAPIAEQEFLDLEEYERDMARLGKLFDHECRWIHLMGGEPLLNPDITKIMEITRRHFTWGKLMIVTNGLLLKQMSEAFWQACRDYDIEIYATKYPVNCDYERASEIAKENGVHFTFYNNGKKLKMLFRWPLSVAGLENPEDSFVRCDSANDCLALKHGRVYPCDAATYVHHLAKKFHLPFQESKRDSIDIYEAKSAEEIMEFCAKPIPFCRYCAIKNRTVDHPFGQSAHDRYEWIEFEGNAADWEYLRAFERVFLCTDGSRSGRHFAEQAALHRVEATIVRTTEEIAAAGSYDEKTAFLLCYENREKRSAAEKILWDKQAAHIIPAYLIPDVTKD